MPVRDQGCVSKSGVTAGRDRHIFMEIDAKLADQLDKELRLGWNQNRVQAEIEAKRISEVNKQRHKSIEGLGQLTARIPMTAFHFWGQKLGYGCWNDQAFMDEFLRDNPKLRVNSGGTKEIHVGWTPSK